MCIVDGLDEVVDEIVVVESMGTVDLVNKEVEGSVETLILMPSRRRMIVITMMRMMRMMVTTADTFWHLSIYFHDPHI